MQSLIWDCACAAVGLVIWRVGIIEFLNVSILFGGRRTFYFFVNFFLVSETGSASVDQIGFKLLIVLLHPAGFWVYRCVCHQAWQRNSSKQQQLYLYVNRNVFNLEKQDHAVLRSVSILHQSINCHTLYIK